MKKQFIATWEYFDRKLQLTIKHNYTLVMVSGVLIRVFNHVKVYDGSFHYIIYNSLNKNSEVFQFFKSKYEDVFKDNISSVSVNTNK